MGCLRERRGGVRVGLFTGNHFLAVIANKLPSTGLLKEVKVVLCSNTVLFLSVFDASAEGGSQ
jgi:hypothetical protein